MTPPLPGGEGAPGTGAPVGLALTAAAAAAALPVVPFVPYAAPYAFGFAWLHAVLIAYPAYRVMSRTRRLTEGAAVGGGCLVGAVPALLVATALPIFQAPDSSGEVWANGLAAAFIFGILGMLGGAAFWAVMRRHVAPRDAPAVPGPAPSPAPAPRGE